MKIRRKNKGLAGLVIISTILFTGCGSEGLLETYQMESGGISFTNEYSSPSELGVGDIMYINFDDSGGALINFNSVSSNAKFTLVVGSASTGGKATSYQLSGDISTIVEKDVSAELPEDPDYTAEEVLSAWLRAAEYDLSVTEPAHSGNMTGTKAMMNFKAVSVGDVESFRVLSSLNSTTVYTLVDGRVRCVGDAITLYVDLQVNAADLNDDDIQSLCQIFNDVAEKEQSLFGEISDIDGDGRIAILLTPQINRLGSMGGGIITGYFWAGDLYPQSGSNPVSNEREIIYMMVPDPDGTYGTTIAKDFTLNNLLPAVFPHELQHAINYNQHVLVKGAPPEQNWLNEGISHLAEDLMGYGQENPSRYALYLANTEAAGLVTLRQPNLFERGAAYLFLRYLYEQSPSGDTFVKNLETSSAVGIDNLEQAFGGSNGFSQFHEMMARWTAALAMTNEGITQDSHYIYRDRVKDSETGHWKGVCLKCSADDGRGTILDGVDKIPHSGSQSTVIAASAAQFYNISSVPSQISIEGSSGGASFGVLIRQE